MKIIIQPPEDGEEELVIFRCRELSNELMQLIAKINAEQQVLIGYDKEQIYRVHPSEVYYFEAVENRTYMYCKNSVYEIKQKLYQLEEIFTNGDFLRVSKSVILNISQIVSMSPAFNGRFEVQLYNGEKIIISRQYVSDFKRKLEI